MTTRQKVCAGVGGGALLLVAALAVAWVAPVTLSEPPPRATVYVDFEGEFVPGYAVPEAESWRYQPMAYEEALAEEHGPRDPGQMRVTAPSALRYLAELLLYDDPELYWRAEPDTPVAYFIE